MSDDPIFSSRHHVIAISEVAAVELADRRGTAARYDVPNGLVYLKSGQTIELSDKEAREVKKMKEANADE